MVDLNQEDEDEAPGAPQATLWPANSVRGRLDQTSATKKIEEGGSGHGFHGEADFPHPPSFSAPARESRLLLGTVIGRGGMGEVFEAYQEALKRVVAVKTIRGEHWRGTGADERAREELRQEFVREALISARLEHPNIAPVHDLVYCDDSNQPQLAMKLVRGEPWHRLLARDMAGMGEAEFLNKHLPVLERVAQAVAFAHSRGIMHRDLKPSQVIVGAYGETSLMDWGLALQFAEPMEESTSARRVDADVPTLASATNPAGTPCMMAPEQTTSDPSQLGPHTDIYLLGGILYFLLTGSYPHKAETRVIALARAAAGEVLPARVRNPNRWIPDDLAGLAAKALSPAPQDRVGSATEFIAALQDYLTGASRRRESEAVLAEARKASDQPVGPGRVEQYRRDALVAERISRALELWPENRSALQLRAIHLPRRFEHALGAGDLLLAESYHADLVALARAAPELAPDPEPFAQRIAAARTAQERHHRQRTIFAWAATLLLLGHAIGMTWWVAQNRSHSMALQEQKEEMARRADIEIRSLSITAGNLLMADNRPDEALAYYGRAMALTQILDGPSSEAALTAAAAFEEAIKKQQANANDAPPSTND